MSNNNFELRGRVVQTGTDRGIPDLRIVAADRESQLPTMMFRSSTDESGEFCIDLTRDDASRLFDPGQSQQQIWSQSALLYVSVFNGDALLTTETVRFQMEDLARGRLSDDIDVALASSNQFSVHGRLLNPDGTGVPDALVYVDRVDPTGRTQLANELTDAEGNFDLEYTGVVESTLTATNIAIALRASDVMGTEIATTPVIVDPDPRHRVDLLTADIADYRGLPEYTRVATAIGAYGSNPTADDLELLVKRTGLPADQVAMAIQAGRIATARGIPPEASYALMRAGLPADVPGQLAQSRQSIREALQRAVDGNLVGDTQTDGNAFDVETLVSLYTTTKSTAILQGDDPTLANIVTSSALPTATTELFVTRWTEHEGTESEFWNGLRDGDEFTGLEVDALEFTLGASGITRAFVPAVSAIQAERLAGNISTLQDLAAWDATAWQSFVSTHGAPDDLEGETQAEREALYATTLQRDTEDKFQTQTVLYRLQANPLAQAAGVVEFLQANPDFDLRETSVPAYLELNPSAIPTTVDVAAAEANLRRVQRVYSLTPKFHRYDVTRALLEQDIESAAQVVHMGRALFIDRVASGLEGVHGSLSGREVAQAVYAVALQKHGFAQALLANYAASMNTISVDAIAANAMQGNEGPGASGLAELFGSLDYCACEHCHSMFGPSAYLVDLLSMLESSQTMDAFASRRGDIRDLELTCQNTDTVLPYIDVVNEVLEEAALSPMAQPSVRQTTWSSAELRLNPEPTGNEAAYDGPAQAVFPWSLPVDVPLVETRAHLDRLGVSRAEAISLFVDDSMGLAQERLGMSDRAFDITLDDTSVSDAELWGFDAAEEAMYTFVLRGDVRRVLDATSLSFEALTTLLTMRSVANAPASGTLEVGPETGQGPTCNINDMVVHGFDREAARSIHRFLRLARRIDATWRELDIMIQAFRRHSDGTLLGPEDWIVDVCDALEVRARLGIPLDESLWRDLDTHSYDGRPSVFATLFQSNAVLAEAQGAFELGDPLDEATHFGHLRSALRVNDTDLRMLVARLPPSGPVDITYVSQLFRHARLARALGIRVAQFLRYLDLIEVAPFESPANTLAFADVVTRVEASSIGLDGYEYLARHRFLPELGIHPSSDDVAEMVQEIAAAKSAVDLQLAVDGAPIEVFRTRLTDAIADTTATEGIIEAVDALTGLDSGDLADALLALEGTLAETDAAQLLSAWRATVQDPAVTEPEMPASADERYAALSESLVALQRLEQYEQVVLDRLASFVSLDAESVFILATQLVHTTAPVRSVLVNAPAPTDDEHRQAIELFHKAAFLVDGLGVEARDLPWIFSSEHTATLDLSSLPLQEDESGASGRFARVVGVASWVESLAQLSDASASLPLINAAVAEAGVEAGSEPDQAAMDVLAPAYARLAEVAGVDGLDIVWAMGTDWLSLHSVGVQTPEALAQILAMAKAVRKTGVRAQDLAGWARTSPDAAAARDSKKALRARHSEAAWPDVIRPISDTLRELRRDALLDFIIARGDFANPEAVYAHYLLDPEMNACMLTSRIKLAISAVQLFVQRGLMQLEDSVAFSPAIAESWEWRKNYRVWEAGRKVFFYPENWISPELRPSKTPFFEEFEAHLQQGELTEEHIERGLRDYVGKLHEVSNLAILDMHVAYEGVEKSVHAVGRTQAEPYKYFYRKKVGRKYWTPWEEIEVGISGENLILSSFESRLFLFWMEVVESGDKDAERGLLETRVRFLQTERTGEFWSSKVASKLSVWSSPTLGSEPLQYMMWGGAGVGPILSIGAHFMPQSLSTRVVGTRFDLRTREFSGPSILSVLPGVHASDFGVIANANDPVVGSRLRGNASQLVLFDENTRSIVPGWQWEGFVVYSTPCHQGSYRSGDRPYAVQTPVGTFFAESTVGKVYSGGDADLSPFDGIAVHQSTHGSVEPVDVASTEDSILFDTVVAQATVATTANVELLGFIGESNDGGSVVLARIQNLCHPLTFEVLSELNVGGVPALFGVDPQSSLRRQGRWFQMYGRPGDSIQSDTPVRPVELSEYVAGPFPRAEFEFNAESSFAEYNWELFYHIPLLVSKRLRAEGRYEDADRWARYVFDPQNGDLAAGASRFWMTKPLYREAREQAGLEEPGVIQSLFSAEGPESDNGALPGYLQSVARWTEDPFNPHAIASVRSGTYRWVAFRAYLDNLIDWADSLFRRDTVESINEATQLYILAGALLGRRPERVSEIDVATATYASIQGASNFGGTVEVEDFGVGGEPALQILGYGGSTPVTASNSLAIGPVAPPPGPSWWTFCLPANPQLLAYWDTVADRLFKIRNCQNIEGVERQLALFQPPIDPALLVRARAAGLDLGDVISGLDVSLSHYRYRTLASRAVDLCGDVRALGGALLTALEKKDGEALARLRATHETATLNRMRDIRVKHVEEAAEQIESLQRSKAGPKARVAYYSSREKVSSSEQEQISSTTSAGALRIQQQVNSAMGAVMALIPDITIGLAAGATTGGSQFQAVANLQSQVIGIFATMEENKASLAGLRAGHERRWDDWQHQLELAKIEIEQIDKQIIAAEIRKSIAETELKNHDKQIEQAEEIQAYYKDKFTNQELYGWMIGETSRLYFQAYKLAYDMAKKAERAMQFELETDDSFLEFGYWDSLKKGLMAGERLHLDIKRMESAYLEKDKRELELTKRVSLRHVAPEALQDLRDSGECTFDIPEVVFDLDHAGHYLRRMRAVRVSIPAVAGPQTSIGATLTLLRDDLRTAPRLDAADVRTTHGGTQRIATSHAREDGGLFELSFRDERYLPFEGAGVSSRWSLRLPQAIRQFDYNTISDVEIRIDYTARDGGAVFRRAVEAELEDALSAALSQVGQQGIALVLSAKKDFAVDWERFLRPADGQLSTAMDVPITLERFPHVMRGLSPRVQSVEAVFVGEGYELTGADAELSSPSGGGGSMSGTDDTLSVDLDDEPVTNESWGIDLGSAIEFDDADTIEDLWVIVRFSIDLPNS